MERPIVGLTGEDPRMAEASARARETFRFFWRELTWERRREVPLLDVAAIKLPFPADVSEDGSPTVEHMWIEEVGFDGLHLSGTLLNDPQRIAGLSAGSPVRRPARQLEDWLYAIDGIVYGGFTVQVLRETMSAAERRAHDAAWGLDFAPPDQVRIIPSPEDRERLGFFARLAGRRRPSPVDPTSRPFFEHPMGIASLASAKALIERRPELLAERDELGMTMLHREALAGNLGVVRLLIERGADPHALTAEGQTALQLAAELQWTPIVRLLERIGA